MNTRPKILLSCGEPSGDLHASALVEEIRRRFPGASIVALGGDRVARAGAELLHRIDDYAIMGFSGVLWKLPKFVKLERRLKRELEDGVDLFIAVDYPGLNLRLAAHAKKAGVPVLYYIGPQIWAWGERRAYRMARTVDRAAVILPFEEELFRHYGIHTEFVGHPFVTDHLLPPPLPQEGRRGVGLLPGSRVQEVQRILPILLESARLIRADYPDEVFTVARNPAVPSSVYESIRSRCPLKMEIGGDATEIMRSSKLLLSASGTATLQGALLETPLIVVYKLSPLNYLIARRLVKIRNIGLVNILLGEEVCPEFIQHEAKPVKIRDAAARLLEKDDARTAMIEKFAALRSQLGGRGGCRRVAEISGALLNHT